MMAGEGPHGPLEMGGMFTVLKMRDNQPRDDYTDPGWYQAPAGTTAWLLDTEEPPPVATPPSASPPASNAPDVMQVRKPSGHSHH